ncbi:MAG: glycoside hydrolase family 127 protein [Prevotellaceae bacterium]|nr:glycoside hydrolase family 127 protein [Prevotellaceae bacterium]
MKKTFLLLFFTATCSCSLNAFSDSGKTGYPIDQVAFTSVKIADGSFWGQRIKAARDVTIPLAFSKCQSEGRYENFVKAAHPSKDYKVTGFSFDDTDVYKTIEGASYVLQTYPDKKLTAYIDSVLDVVAKAQEPDGYLYTPRTMNPEHPHSWSGDRRWVKEEVLSHELYNLGHMVDAAVAHYQATGSTKFLDIAKRYAECVIREVGPSEGQAHVVPGHQIAEMALARLYVLTGEKKYLDEAKFFLDYRGKTAVKDIYTQSNKPVTEQKEAVGHAVRAGYMYAGMADVAALTGDSTYIKAIDDIWENIVGKKYYITGGVGARHAGEAFGSNYELPNLTAYNETCAAIAQVYLNQRMFLLHGDAKYIDCLERTLYNGVISGMSVDGGRFFYPNPLSCDGKYHFNSDNTIERQPWFGCACCPSNLCRFIPSIPGYLYAVKDNSVYVNLYAANTSEINVNGKKVVLEEETKYPWNGDISIRIASAKTSDFRMMLRIPGWVRNQVVPSDLYSFADDVKTGYKVSVNGEETSGTLVNGYLVINRKWRKGDVIRIHFDMEPRLVKASERVVDDRGRIAVERGPLVYCAEAVDNGFDVFKFVMGKKPAFTTVERPELINGIIQLKAEGQVLEYDNDGKITAKDATLTLIPYYAWNHRGVGKMLVWLNNGVERLDY